MKTQLKITFNRVMYRLFGHIPYPEYKHELQNDRLDESYKDSSYNAFDLNTKPFNFN